MSKTISPTTTYAIIGIWEDGQEAHLFRWKREPEAGIEQAKKQTKSFGYDFVEFRAVRIEG